MPKPARFLHTAARRCFSSKKSSSYGLTGNPSDPTWQKMTCARSNIRAVGWEDDDMRKPVITVAAPVSTIMPCNHHHQELAEIVCAEVEKRGGKASICYTPVISDGTTQGTDAMRYSLISRDVIADCIEIMHAGYYADGIITLGGCDKTVPGVAMPLARMNLTGLTLYGGAAMPGRCEKATTADGQAIPGVDRNMDPGTVMEGIGSFGAGKINQAQLDVLERVALPTRGCCSAMFTANTMASAMEGLGLALPGTASHPAVGYDDGVTAQKHADCAAAADAVFNLLELKIKARDILTYCLFALTVCLPSN
jgi:dihydroxy-acid dehydratase